MARTETRADLEDALDLLLAVREGESNPRRLWVLDMLIRETARQWAAAPGGEPDGRPAPHA